MNIFNQREPTKPKGIKRHSPNERTEVIAPMNGHHSQKKSKRPNDYF
jgi:hypothetical protein